MTPPCSLAYPGRLTNRLQSQLAQDTVGCRWDKRSQVNRQQAYCLGSRIEHGVEAFLFFSLACQLPRLALFDILIGASYKPPDDTQGIADFPRFQCRLSTRTRLCRYSLQVLLKLSI